MNIFKSILNFFFPEKKKERTVRVIWKQNKEEWITDEIIDIAKKQIEEFKHNENKTLSKDAWVLKPKLFGCDKNDFDSDCNILTTKNEFRKLALSHGYEARYSGREKFFYLHKRYLINTYFCQS